MKFLNIKSKKTVLITSILIFSTLILPIFLFGSYIVNISDPDNFSWEDEESLIDAIIIFNSNGIELDIPDEYIIQKYEFINGINAKIPENMFEYLEKSDYISSIDINGEMQVYQDLLDWGVDDTEAEQVWGLAEDAVDIVGGYTGAGVKIAVLDSGIDYTHPELDANYKGGYDFVDFFPNPDAKDLAGHGTMCAGIIAAEDNDIGVIGVAPEADLYGVRIINSWGTGTDGNFIKGIEWCIENEMDIISMSFGKKTKSSSIETAIKAAYAAGITLVASSGNIPELGSTEVAFPAAFDETIAVGATRTRGRTTTYSCYGEEINVVAPGNIIYSTMPTYTVTLNWLRNMAKNYEYGSGTSMAAPMVTGICALMLQANPNLTPDDIKDILQMTATDINETGFDERTGHGLVNAKAAVDLALSVSNPDIPSKVNGLEVGSGSVSLGLNWISNPEVDINHYNIYRNGDKVGETYYNSFVDSPLESNTQYTYEISAVDFLGNEGFKSDPITQTTSTPPVTDIYVENIEMDGQNIVFLFWVSGYKIFTEVTIKDATGGLIDGVTVTMKLDMPLNGYVTMESVTNSNGIAFFEYSNSGFGDERGEYISTILDLQKSGYTYNNLLNIESSESYNA
ncbi:MAG: S8 family serine peptidase [archaeon]|nr:S8 family serine peptidase [archaeon]